MHTRLIALSTLALSLACRTGGKVGEDGTTNTDTGELAAAIDADGDGYVGSEDCDDDDATVNPDATEVCDGVDNDCDGEVDEDLEVTWYTDADGDGYGETGTDETGCVQPSGTVLIDGDCDDDDENVYPDAREVCDGVDNDCNGVVDDGGTFEWYLDADGDGFGDPSEVVEDCARLEGYAKTGDDCDDTDAAVNPDATEVCDDIDNDCDGTVDGDDAVDASTWYLDADGDGYGDDASPQIACVQPSSTVADGGDCDDANIDVNPGATEVCDFLDNDCDGLVDDDDGDVDLTGAGTWYEDRDGDGFGAVEVQACAQPSGAVADDGDCDDRDFDINPAAPEVCNGIDDDCDTLVDGDDGDVDLTTATSWYVDADSDGYGGSTTVESCSQPAGTTATSTDCDDANSAINPGASEVCNGVDDDCDTLVDDDDSSVDLSTASTYYADVDSDGYGDASASTQACSRPTGYRANSTDCDDGDASINPGEAEICNGVDDDCDTLVDDDDTDLDTASATTWYEDVDADGYGDASGATQISCDEPSGFVDDSSDCDDDDVDVNPAATEACNGYDDDCDGVADSSSVCPCNVEYYTSGEEPYLFCETAEPWVDARTTCLTYGYDLATINTTGENTWMDTVADSYSTAKWWVGLNDRATEGTWEWASGQTYSYTSWHPNEPNDSGGNEDCGQLNRYTGGLWNDEPCASSFRYICEAN